MRARLEKVWPNLSHYFGIHPWDVDRLTVPELRAYFVWLDDLRKQNEAAARAARRR